MKHPMDTSAWGDFVVGELFDNIYSVRQVKSQRNIVDELKGIPFVVQTQTNNMVKCYASKNTFNEHNVPIIKGNSIAMGVDLAVISYQENDYGGSHIIVAESDKLNPLRGKFIVAIMTAKLGPKYNYINKPGVQKYKQDVIPLPLKPFADPSNYSQADIDWNYMETVMSRVTTRAKERLASLPQPTDKKKTPVDTSAWGEFVVGELFDNIYSVRQVKSQRNIVDELKGIPFVVQTQTNNMVKCYASKNTFNEHNVPIIKGNSIAMGVDLAVISYQENDYGGSHIIVAESDKLNPLRGKFIVAIMTAKLGPKYNYINKPGVQKYKQDVIPLPLKPSASPSNYTQEDIDWDYMENFMKTIEEKAHNRLKTLQKTIA